MSGSASEHIASRRFLRQLLDDWPASAPAWRVRLYQDLLGLAWVAVHLDSPLADDSAEADPWEEFDDLLPGLVDMLSDDMGCELVCGHVGLGTYAIERLPGRKAEECLARIVAGLAASARQEGRGLAWPRTAAEGSWQKKACAGPYFDLGVAHGIAGIIAFLGEVCCAGVAAGPARALLGPAVAWLLDQRMDGGEGPCFPALAGPGIERTPTRLAWCYGDAGIAGALLHAARCVGEASWEREAIGIARRATNCNPDRARVVDATLCHGAVGLAHIFNRFFQATGEEVFRKEATTWYSRALRLRRASGRTAPNTENGFLNGAAGIGLGLLAAVSPVEPGWDRLLLLSGPSGLPGTRPETG